MERLTVYGISEARNFSLTQISHYSHGHAPSKYNKQLKERLKYDHVRTRKAMLYGFILQSTVCFANELGTQSHCKLVHHMLYFISFAAPQRYSNSMSSSAGMRAHTGARLTADTALELGRVRLGRRLIMAQMTQQQPNPSAATTPAIETQVRR